MKKTHFKQDKEEGVFYVISDVQLNVEMKHSNRQKLSIYVEIESSCKSEVD